MSALYRSSLHDKPSPAVKRARRNTAGCGGKNKCVEGGKGTVKAANQCKRQVCENDGWQFQVGKISKREEEPQVQYFKTNSGMVNATTHDIEPMFNFTREADDAPDGERLASMDPLDTRTEDKRLRSSETTSTHV